jgi:thiol-disulfide isomerase/thioredoxin
MTSTKPSLYGISFADLPAISSWLNRASSDRFVATELTIVYFWSKSCPSCHANMPALQRLRDDYANKGLQVVSIHRPMGDFDLDTEEICKVTAELGVTEPCALDNDHKIGDALGVKAWPTYFLFDAEGKLRRHATGNFGVRMIEQALIRMYKEGTDDEDDN